MKNINKNMKVSKIFLIIYIEQLPPVLGSKKEVFKLRSVNNIVIAPANTGNDNTNKNTVTKTVHTNKLMCSKEIDLLRKFFVVHIKLIPPKIDLNPAQ